jgi:HEAT repeat protein/MFS family permease
MLLKLRNKFLNKLGIKPAEQNKVYWSMLLVICTGILRCLISSFPMALFLSSYGSESLPKIYLVVAALYFLIGIVYGFFEYRVSYNWLVIGLVLTLATVQTILGIGNVYSAQPWIIMGLAVWASITFNLLDLAIWTILNQIFTLQQAKNVFGLIGGLQCTGGLLGGVLTPILVIFFQIKYLILSLGVLTFCVVLIIVYMLKSIKKQVHKSKVEIESSEEDDVSDQLQLKTILSNKYVLKIFTLVTVGVFGMYIIDLLFNTAAGARYTSQAALAGFLGLFYGLVDGLDLFSSVFIFSWILKRAGLVAALMVLPTLLILIITPLLLILQAPLLIHFVFWFIILLKLLEEGLRASLSDMSILLLWQPFHPKVRSFLMSKSDSIVVGIATAVVSGFLLILTSTVGISTGFLAMLALVCYSLALCIIFTLKSDYVKALTKAIANRYFETNNTLALTREDLDLLKKYLSSSYPDEVIYALKTIEKIDEHEFAQILSKILKSKDEMLLTFALEKIKQYHLKQYYSAIISILQENQDDSIKAKALELAAHLDYSHTQQYLNMDADEGSLLLCNTLVISYTYDDDPDSKQRVLKKIQRMSTSNEEMVRINAARIIGEISNADSNKLLPQLIQDSSDEVRRECLESIFKVHYIPLYGEVIENIILLQISNLVLEHIAQEQEKFIEIIQSNFARYSEPIKTKCIFVLGQIQSKLSQTMIERIVLSEQHSTRQIALDVLTEFSLPFEQEFLDKIFKLIIEEANYLKLQKRYLSATPMLDLTALLRSFLDRKVELSVQRLFSYLTIYYEKSVIEKAKNGLAHNREDERSYAIELLDSCLKTQHKKILTPLLSNIYLAEPEVGGDLNSKAFREVLRNTLKLKNKEQLTVLGCIAGLFIVIRGSLDGYAEEIAQLQRVNDKIIQETMGWLTANTKY